MMQPLFALGLALQVALIGFPAGANQSRQGVLLRYDTNRDGRLDADERAQARAHLERRPTAFGRSVAVVDENPAARRSRLMERYDLDRSGALSHQEATLARESFANARVRGSRTETDPLGPSGPSATPSNPFGFPDWPAETTAPVASAERGATPLGSSTTSPVPPSARALSSRAPSGAAPSGPAASPTRSATRPSAAAPEPSSTRSLPHPRSSPAVAPPKPDPFYNQPVSSGKGGGKAGAGKAGAKGKAGAGGAKPGGGGGRRAGRGPIF